MEQGYIEIKAKTLEDAITAACQRLSVISDRLDYIVVSEGSSGFLGFNAKPAVIKARIKAVSLSETESVLKDILNKVDEKAKKTAEEDLKEKDQAEKQEEAFVLAGGEHRSDRMPREHGRRYDERHDEPGRHRERRNHSPYRESGEPGKEEPAPENKKIPAEQQLSDEAAEEIKAKAEKFLGDVFGAMGMTVSASMSFDKEWNLLNLDLSGDEMGVLIGKRGQTLDSLQYLVSLIVNRDTEQYIHVKADTENYRARRKETLENLARNIAYKVKRTRRPVALEPMNPYERRIIHSALQGDRYVTTHSEGEEPYRKVVVTMKR
ncbi:RNA-binding cell elongation regulator Jag/EloR [Lachnoclostridium sp. Marseille-P6806]|uniref:RNA-binding cell elongation regulator Jag/EloR n=1 Tax=Lachnoclostridium sp. Marseille-P6806 TaxID=2364793 RepID=UPI00103115EF|nr:RNA-binding cell elongation regulator Jag/EloR [Lachnoclostridium sp. Marseille-P6806]